MAAEATLRVLLAPEADATEPLDVNNQLPRYSSAFILARLRPGILYEEVESNEPVSESDDATLQNHGRFHLSCVVDGISFFGRGFNKKKARAQAAAEALANIFGITCTESCGEFLCKYVDDK